MHRSLAICSCCLVLAASVRGDEPLAPDGTPLRQQGGIIVSRTGDTTTLSLGGGLFPRRIRMKIATPDGPFVTRFTLPPNSPIPAGPPLPNGSPASLRVDFPDADGVLYVDGELVRGRDTSRLLQSPPLPPGKEYPLHLRAAFKVGDNLLIEDKQVLIRAGESIAVTFDGSRAVVVPLPTKD